VKKLNGFALEERAPSPKNGSRALLSVDTLGLKGKNGLGLSLFSSSPLEPLGSLLGFSGAHHAERSAHGEKMNGHPTTLKAAELESRAASQEHQHGVASVDASDHSTRVRKTVMEATQFEAQPRVRKRLRKQYDEVSSASSTSKQYDAGKKRHTARQAVGPALEVVNAK
jgi:hypothetical protein